MKKFLMMVVCTLCLSVATFANNINVFADFKGQPCYSLIENDTCNYNFDMNYNKIACYLELDEETLEQFKYIHKEYCWKMRSIAKFNNEDKRNLKVRNAMRFEIANMRSILNYKQYRNFLRVFNVNLMVRGFQKDVMSFCRN